MLKRSALGAFLATVFLLVQGGTHAEEQASERPQNFYDISGHFLRFWDATTDLDIDERTDRFIEEVATQFPAYYSRYTRGEAGRDQIARQIAAFGDIRSAYIAKADAFEDKLAANLETFRAAFPDFEIKIPIVLMHSLGEFDGRATVLGGQQFLLFGADGMARLHPEGDESAFFHHELFHILHFEAFTTCGTVWCRMWPEGLAASVAHDLNLEAGTKALLLDLPAGTVAATKASLAASLEEVKANLDSRDPVLIASLFSFRPQQEGLPQRRGYYLGYLIAEEAARDHSLRDLAAMPNEQARPVFEAALDRLIAGKAGKAGAN